MAGKRAQSIASLKRQRTRRLMKLIGKAYWLHQRGKEEQLYNAVCDEFVDLGGVYVKFLQGVMLNSTMMRKWHSPNRLKIFENLESEPLDVVQILRSELPAEALANIALVQPAPFAAGSFGQVYYGQHANGQPIIIKVLRPLVHEMLRHDLRLLGMFSKGFAGREYPNVQVKFSDAFREFRQATLRETDYVGEARFAHELYESFKDHQHIVIPQTYLELCTNNIIVQEYISGVSGVELIRIKDEGGDPAAFVAQKVGSNMHRQLEILGVEFLNSAFNLPRIQGDPHPGNIRLLPEDKVAIIDFGISAHAPEDKAAFFGMIKEWTRIYNDNDTSNMAGLFEQFMRFFVNDLYRALKKLSSFINNGTEFTIPAVGHGGELHGGASALKEVGKIMQQVFAGAIGTSDIRSVMDDGNMLKVFNQVVNKGNRFGLVVKLNASEMLRAAQTYMTLLEAIGDRRYILPRVFAEVQRRAAAEHPELLHQSDDAVSISEALETIHRWLERVAQRDPALFRQLVKRIKLHRSKDDSTEKTSHA